MNKNVLYGLIGIAVLEFIAIIALSLQVQNQKISPNILSLTPPVTYLNGTVKKISGNTITVVQDRTNVFTAPPSTGTQAKLSPTPTPPAPSYEVTIDKKTVISRPLSSMVTRLFSSAPSQKVSPTVKDIRKGDQVSILSATDLRMLSGNRFTATAISLPPVNNYLTGSIIRVTDRTVLIHSAIGAAGGKDYLFNITKDTEISVYATETVGGTLMSAPKRYSLTDLKPQQQISVWTNEDITGNNTVTAVRIQPMVTPAATVTPSVTVTLSPTPPIAPIP